MTSVAATQFLPVATTATASARSLIVSLHDVAPATWEKSRNIISDLHQRGIRVCCLLVVPDYHHGGPSIQNAGFLSWLRDLEQAGNEIVIHGYFHQRPRRPKESVFGQFVTRIYTQDEGEFYDLPYDEARRRITTAREEFEAAGFRPHGFVAPAWLLGADGERAARDCGMEYTTRLTSVLDLRSGNTFASRSLVYSVQNEWRRSVSMCWNALLAQISRSELLARFSIHPVDHDHPQIWNQICRLMEGMQSNRTPTTYHDWIAEWRIRRTMSV